MKNRQKHAPKKPSTLRGTGKAKNHKNKPKAKTSTKKGKGLGSLGEMTPERFATMSVGFAVVGFGLWFVWKRLNGEDTNKDTDTKSKTKSNTTNEDYDVVKVSIPAAGAFPLAYQGWSPPYNSAVKEWQTLLMQAGYTLPAYGADGKFGSETLAATRKAIGKDVVNREDYVALANQVYGNKSNVLLIKKSTEQQASDGLSGLALMDSLAGFSGLGALGCGCGCGGKEEMPAPVNRCGGIGMEKKTLALAGIENGQSVYSQFDTILFYENSKKELAIKPMEAGKFIGKKVAEGEFEGKAVYQLETPSGKMVLVPAQDVFYAN